MAGYTGLATGAGAAAGLETLFARMREEEKLRQSGLNIDFSHQDRQAANATDQDQLNETSRQFDANAPVRQANVGQLNASAAHMGAETEHITGENSVLRGLLSDLGAQPSANPGTGVVGLSSQPPAQGASPGQPAGPDLNNPLGRIRLRTAGIPPNDVYGSVDVPNTETEQLWRAFAEKNYGNPNHPLSYDEKQRVLREKPTTVISQGNLDQRKVEFGLRTRLADLTIAQKEMELKGHIDPLKQSMALVEFRDRVKNDVQSKQSWSQWIQGENAPDISAQVQVIADDIIKKYGTTGQGSAPVVTGQPPVVKERTYNPQTRKFE